MKPTTGRVVHYWSHGSADGVYEPQCWAAIVTESYGNGVNLPDGRAWEASLAVLNPEGMFFKQDVHQDEKKSRGGTWHWPEREEEFDAFLDASLKVAVNLAKNKDVVQQVHDGLKSIDDARRELGQEPWGLPETS